MALVMNTNVSSLLAQRRLDINSSNLRKSMERLSSGYRLNRAADDAAGLSISKNLESQILRMKQASRNTTDGIGVLQIAEGALTVINDSLQRVRELTVQAANDTYDTTSRQALSSEIISILEDIDRVATSANFNGIFLLNGLYDPASPTYDPNQPAPLLQVGANSDTLSNTVNIAPALRDSTAAGIGLVGSGTTAGFANINAINLTSNATAQAFIDDVDRALQNIGLRRGAIGAYQNKLDSVLNNLTMSIENFSLSNSRIRDVDVAAESANMIQSQILTESATMILSQTNNLPKMILGLLQR